MLNPSERKINLGVVKVNEKLKRAVRITNNSLATVDFNLTITPSTQCLQNNNVLSVFPNALMSLKPKATSDVVVVFHPKERIPQFSEEV